MGRQSSDHKGPNLPIWVSFSIMNLDFIWLGKKSQGRNLTCSRGFLGILKTTLVDWKWVRLDGKSHLENGFHCGVVSDQKFSLFSLKEILLTPYKLHLLLVLAGWSLFVPKEAVILFVVLLWWRDHDIWFLGDSLFFHGFIER